ncbi:MAG: zinc-binding dehydrogenase [Reichenbachiella sp.]
MIAAYYTEQGLATEVLQVGQQPTVLPQSGEVQIKIQYSGINPGETKKRGDTFALGMPYPIVIPQSDGMGEVSAIGQDVDKNWLGKKVMCIGAQSYRPFGTAAEFCSVPTELIFELPQNVDPKQAAQLGIPGITGHRSIMCHGDVSKKRILVQAGNGAVGQCAIAIAKHKGAYVIASVRKAADKTIAQQAGADQVLLTSELNQIEPKSLDHIVEIDFGSNLTSNIELLKNGGSMACYAKGKELEKFPFWNLVFENISLHFLGSDDFTLPQKRDAISDILAALQSNWKGLAIGKIYPLEEIANAHLHVEQRKAGRALIKLH